MIPLAHLPTILLLIGYPVFWVELFAFNTTDGLTSPLAASLVLVCVLWLSFIRKIKKEDQLDFFGDASLWSRVWMGCCLALSAVIIFVSLYAACLPPHLVQESDVLIYHLTVPRQHLVRGDFSLIPWSVADLYFLPVNFALAPFWFLTALPNKFPQFIFFLGLIAVAMNLSEKFSRSGLTVKILAAFAILGSHCIGVQLGTGMLDIVIAYLFFASLDSLLSRRYFLSAVEFSFYFWSKSFMPLQTLVVAALIGCLVLLFRFLRSKGMSLSFDRDERFYIEPRGLKKWLISFFVLSILIGGPFAAKSIYYSGSPLFPIGVGSVNLNPQLDQGSPRWQAIHAKSKEILQTKDDYGQGRSLVDFVKHFWLIAVPDQGVNNRFDYPAGLMYLICLGPFFYYLIVCLKNGRIPVLGLVVIAFWSVWWMGSQQTRFLYVPIILMYLLVLARMPRPSYIFKTAVLVALVLTSLSVVRAHKADFGKPLAEVLRPKDRMLYEQSRHPGQGISPSAIPLDFEDAAFAGFPVDVQAPASIFVLNY